MVDRRWRMVPVLSLENFLSNYFRFSYETSSVTRGSLIRKLPSGIKKGGMNE